MVESQDLLFNVIAQAGLNPESPSIFARLLSALVNRSGRRKAFAVG